MVITILSRLGAILIVCGASLTLIGVATPWAQAELFGGLHIQIPGLFFTLGGISAVCAIMALTLRRAPLLCIAVGLVLLTVTNTAVNSIPRTVRRELISAQLSFSPLNQLLDQFHIDTLTVANYGAKDSMYIGEGVGRAAQGGLLILLGGIISLFGDPAARTIRRQIMREHCRNCGASWIFARDALFCPQCAIPTALSDDYCTHCLNPRERSDKYCVQCGTEILSRTASP
jgi:hypothetical protein